jgi:hypothetical protein
VLARLKAEYESRGVYFISLTIEPDDDQQKVEGWLKRAKAESLHAGRASDAVLEKLIRMGGAEPGAIPANVFITADGNVSRSLVAPVSHDAIEAAVAEIAPRK